MHRSWQEQSMRSSARGKGCNGAASFKHFKPGIEMCGTEQRIAIVIIVTNIMTDPLCKARRGIIFVREPTAPSRKKRAPFS